MKREISLLKNTFIIAFGTILPKFASLITLPIITRELSKYEYGLYDMIVTLGVLLLPVITLEIQVAAFRYLIDCEKKVDKQKVISTILIFIVALSLVSLTILFFVLNHYHLQIQLRIIIILYFGVDILFNVLQQIARGLHDNKVFSTSSIIVSITNMISIVFTVQILKEKLIGLMISSTIAYFLAVIYLAFKTKVSQYFNIKYFSVNTLKDMLSYSWPMIPNTLSNWIMNLSDRILIVLFLGVEANAVYAIANKIPNLFTSVQGTFVLAWQENASVASKDDDVGLYFSNMFENIYNIFFAIMACMLSFAPILFLVLIKGDYSSAYNQITILFIAMFFSAISSFIGGIYVATKQTKSIGVTTILSAVVNLFVCICLIKFLGIYAGSISTLVSYFVLAAYRMTNIRKYINITYNYKKIILMILLLVIIAILASFNNIYITIVNIFLGICLSIFFNKNTIFSFISYLKNKF